MANTPSAKKRLRRAIRRTEVNRSRKSRVKTHIRAVEDAIAAGDKSAATEAFKAVEPEIMRGAQKGIMHRNTAARRVSRLSRLVQAMS